MQPAGAATVGALIDLGGQHLGQERAVGEAFAGGVIGDPGGFGGDGGQVQLAAGDPDGSLGGRLGSSASRAHLRRCSHLAGRLMAVESRRAGVVAGEQDVIAAQCRRGPVVAGQRLGAYADRDDLRRVAVSGLAGFNQDDLRVDTPCLERPADPLDDRDRGQMPVAEQHPRSTRECPVRHRACGEPPARTPHGLG